jgi:hypothetical protein
MAFKQAQTTFESILDTPADAVERPKPLPTGTYTAIVQGLPVHGESSKKKTPFVQFTYAITDAGEDVDLDELAEMGGIADKTMKDTYYTTADALFRLTDALENMGIDLEGKTVRQAIDETPNCELKIVVGHRASEDGQQIFAEVKRTMKVD